MELQEHSCCDMQRVYKGAWTPEEDAILTAYMEAHGNQCRPWKDIATDAGLRRCGKSCRFRWLHYLHPSLDRRSFSVQEVQLICNLHRIIGNKWAEIAKFLPGRSDNSIKNFWNAYCKEAYPSIQHQQQQPPAFTTHIKHILQDPPTSYDFTPFQPDQSPVINTSSVNHQSNLQEFDPSSFNYELPPLPESFASPVVNTSLTPAHGNPAYDYNFFDVGISSDWIDPSYSHNQVLMQPKYLESSCVHVHVHVHDLLGTQDQNHLTAGTSSFDHISSDLNNQYCDMMQSVTNNIYTTCNNPSEGYSGTDIMVAQPTHWDLHTSHGSINTYGENYSFDPNYVPFNNHHGNL